MTEKQIEHELDHLVFETFKQNGWCFSDKEYKICKKDPGFTWNAFADKLRPEAIKRAMEKIEKPLTIEDVRELGFEESTIQKALEELNVEILKRIIRKKYPHKFT